MYDADRPKVLIAPTGIGWLVRVHPRPWGFRDCEREFFSRAQADRFASATKARLIIFLRRNRGHR